MNYSIKVLTGARVR